jgi:hypothetical protein
MLEPTATPRDNVNLSLTETVTAVTCSANQIHYVRLREMVEIRDNLPAAFPTIGKRMSPTNPLLMFPLSVRPSMEETRNSAVTATIYSARSALRMVKGETLTDHSDDNKERNGSPYVHLRLVFVFFLLNRARLRIIWLGGRARSRIWLEARSTWLSMEGQLLGNVRMVCNGQRDALMMILV